MNIEKAWNLTFAYSLYRSFSMPFRKDEQRMPTPNVKIYPIERSRRMLCGGIVMSQRAFIAILFWAIKKIPDSYRLKPALINAFIICLQSQLLDFALQRYELFFIYAKEKWLILIKSTFCIWEFFRCSLVLLWFFLGLLSDGDREGTIEQNLNKSAFLG